MRVHLHLGKYSDPAMALDNNREGLCNRLTKAEIPKVISALAVRHMTALLSMQSGLSHMSTSCKAHTYCTCKFKDCYDRCGVTQSSGKLLENLDIECRQVGNIYSVDTQAQQDVTS